MARSPVPLRGDLRDLDRLQEIRLEQDGKRFLHEGHCGGVRACGETTPAPASSFTAPP
jgi:hypothetical protein